MSRRTVAGLVSIAIALTGCTSEVVTGRAVSSSGRPAAQSGARFTDAAAVAQLQNNVRAGVEAVNTYDYRTLDDDLKNALRYTTGKLSTDLRSTYRNVIAKNAASLDASQRAQVNRIGVATLSASTAMLLVFGQLKIRTKDVTTPRTDHFTVVVTATKITGRWLLRKVAVGGGLGAPPPPGTPQLAAAVTAVRAAATALSSFRRAAFDADFARALSTVIGSVRTDVQRTRATTLKTLTDGRFDLAAEVSGAGVEEASGTQAVVLVALNGYRISDTGGRGKPTAQSLRVTATLAGGRWLVSGLESVGVS